MYVSKAVRDMQNCNTSQIPKDSAFQCEKY